MFKLKQKLLYADDIITPKVHSDLLNDTYYQTRDKLIRFEGGATYDEREIYLLMQSDNDTLKAVHMAKTVFPKGELT